MKTVRQILQDKGRDIWAVAPDDSVLHALQVMAEKNVGALVVLAAGNLAGIFSERDYARKVALQGKTAESTSVWEVMTTRVMCVGIDRPIDECMALMTAQRIRHLPVLEHNQLIGVISIGDVVKAVISEQAVIIQQLENYLWGHQS